MMRSLCLIIFFFICFILSGYAQQTLKGRVFENYTRVPLAGISIENTKNKKITETDISGRFSIQAAVNDVLILKGFSYQADTVLLTSLSETELFLEPQKNMLNEVKVTTPGVTGNFHVYDPDFHGQSAQYTMDESGNYKGGVTFRIWWNKKAEKKRRKQQQKEFEQHYQLVIDTVFSPKNLARFLPLHGDDLISFRIRYIPSVAVYTNNNFNLLSYLDKCYKAYMALPPGKRNIPALTK